MTDREALRALPKVDEVLARPKVAALIEAAGRAAVVGAVRALLDTVRGRILAGEVGAAEVPELTGEAAVAGAVAARSRPRLRRVVNATGVVLHTNLGRAPLSPDAADAVRDAAGYGAVEIDLHTGKRGRRETPVSAVAAELLGCEAATAVNNCAAAVMLVLRALAEGREVIVSRGELVEIGGGFRIPEVLAQSGCRLVEVGTTNRTRLHDYARAAGPDTALLLKVHRSNFAVQGFTQEASLEELAGLARELGVPLVHDLGSGLPSEAAAVGALAGEETARGSIAAGADLVCFSGDKLLGGPQAGIIAGRAALVQACHAHPLMRALRCDKLTLAALEATLVAWRDGRGPTLPTHAALQADPAALEDRAREVASGLAEAGIRVEVIEVDDAVGGGSAPLARLPGRAVVLAHPDPEALAAALRAATAPVVGVVREGRLRLHLRTVHPDEVADLVGTVREAWAAAAAE